MAYCSCQFFREMVAGGVKWHCNDCVIPCIDEEAKIEFLHEEAEEQERYDRLQALREQYKEYYEAIEKNEEKERKEYEEQVKSRKEAQSTVEELRNILDFLVAKGMGDYSVRLPDYVDMITVKSIEDVGIDDSAKKIYL